MNRREVDRIPSAPPPFPDAVMYNACLPSYTCCTLSITSHWHFLSHIESILQRRNRLAGLFNTRLLQLTQDRPGSCEKATMRGQRIMLQTPGAKEERYCEYLSPFKLEDYIQGLELFAWAYTSTQRLPGAGIELACCRRGASGSVQLARPSQILDVLAVGHRKT